jgi:hypothetical protein
MYEIKKRLRSSTRLVNTKKTKTTNAQFLRITFVLMFSKSTCIYYFAKPPLKGNCCPLFLLPLLPLQGYEQRLQGYEQRLFLYYKNKNPHRKSKGGPNLRPTKKKATSAFFVAPFSYFYKNSNSSR